MTSKGPIPNIDATQLIRYASENRQGVASPSREAYLQASKSSSRDDCQS